MKKRILFVCLGNICRSPAAEGIAKKILEDKGLSDQFYIDSAGISSYHRGDLPDSRMRACGKKRGYVFNSLSRPVKKDDFDNFDLIIGMDMANIDALKDIAQTENHLNKIKLMTDYCVNIEASNVPDPYYGASNGFDLVIDILEDACENLINELMNS